MCGLAGVAGTLLNTLGRDDTKTFRELLYISSFRGVDSTGIVGRGFGDPKGETQTLKAVGPSADFLDMVKAKSLIYRSDQFVIGHCRSKTVGDVNKANAQPFDFDDIVGTHNGTLEGGTKWRLEGPGQVLGTDSEALYWRINKEGLSAALGLTTDEDAMALVWYNKTDNTLNFYRNKHRPLYYVYDDKRERIFWASESGMLYLILNRNKIAFQKVHFLPENTHYKVTLPTKPNEKIGKPETRVLKQPKRPLVRAAASSARVFVGTGSAVTAAPTIDGITQLAEYVARKGGVQKPTQWNSGAVCSTSGPIQPDMLKPGDIQQQKYEPHMFLMDRLTVRPDKLGGSFYRSSKTGASFDLEQFEHKMSPGCCECGISPAWGEPVRFLKQDENVLCASCMSEAQADARVGRWNGNSLSLLVAFG